MRGYRKGLNPRGVKPRKDKSRIVGFSNASRKAANDKVIRLEKAIAEVKGGKATGKVGAFTDLYRIATAKDSKVYPQVYQVTLASGKATGLYTNGNVLYQERISDARIGTFDAEGLDVNGNRTVKVETDKVTK